MILQTDDRLNESINVYGCYFMSLLYLANKLTGYKLSTTVIISLYNKFIDFRFMSTDCFIGDPDGIFKYLGLKTKYTDTHEPPQRNCAKNEIEILCLKNCNGLTHFVVGDGKGHIAYNPMGVSIGFKLHSKRIFKLL